MYQIDLKELNKNQRIIGLFKGFFKDMVHKTESGFEKPSAYGSDDAAHVLAYTSLPTSNKPNEYGLALPRTFFYKFEFVKSFGAKFETSRVYGLKEKLTESPDILLDKAAFKSLYRSTLIPEYNYDLKIDTSKKKDLNKRFEEDFFVLESMINHVKEELKEIFQKYGEVEVKEINNTTILHIKNTINFYVLIELEKRYKLSEGDNSYLGIVPNYKLAIKLYEGDPIFKVYKDPKGKDKDYLEIDTKIKKYYFRVEFRYLEFLNNPNYFALCMTPHGYIRLKKDYSKDFFNKIIYHYLFKKYFEKYNIDLSNEDLENNPQSFFSLVSMLKY